MRENRLKRILREGGLALGTYGGPFSGTTVAEIIGHAGYDAVFIDMEHQPFDLREVHAMVTAAECVGITPLVRTPGFDPAFILRLLDLGVQGIQIPHITGAAAARAAVDAVRYPPLGDRGMSGSSRATDYGKFTLKQHMEISNREIVLVVMIEDLAAVEEIDEIAATEGVDLVAVGPTDLARALGVAGQPDHPKLVEAIEHIAEAVKQAGNARLMLPLNNALFRTSIARLRELGVGYTLCGPSPEVRLLRSMSQQVAELRQQLG